MRIHHHISKRIIHFLTVAYTATICIRIVWISSTYKNFKKVVSKLTNSITICIRIFGISKIEKLIYVRKTIAIKIFIGICWVIFVQSIWIQFFVPIRNTIKICIFYYSCSKKVGVVIVINFKKVRKPIICRAKFLYPRVLLIIY